MIQKRTIGVIGVGNVGVAAAYALFLNRTAEEIILVDKDRRRAEGEAMDMMHGQAYVGHIAVRAGDYPDLAAAQIVIIAAGVGQRPGESRLELLNRNADVLGQIAAQLDRHAPDAVLLIASNPVDILTYMMHRLSDRPSHRIVGTGTMLDTGRFRALLGKHYQVDPRSVHAYIVGEHGDSEVPLWSKAMVGGIPIKENMVLGRCFDADQMNDIFSQVRDAAYEIIDRKGYTNTAIGAILARLSEAVLEDQKSILTVSVAMTGEYGLNRVCLSNPCVIGFQGIEAKLTPDLDDNELHGIQVSARRLKQNIDKISWNRN
jgi:L-lactate dehydrogenase